MQTTFCNTFGLLNFTRLLKELFVHSVVHTVLDEQEVGLIMQMRVGVVYYANTYT